MKSRSILRQAAFIAVLLFFSALMLDLTIPYLSFKTDVDFLLTKQGILHITPWRISFYIHIILSILVLLAGSLQFSTYIRKNYGSVHRNAGYTYILLILLFSGPSGFVMGIYANGGIAAQISFMLLALLWILFTGRAWYAVVKKRFAEHREWMIRSYALTLSAISLRLMLMLAPKIAYIPPKTLYIAVAWVSWIINLLIAELIIKRKRLPAITVAGR